VVSDLLAAARHTLASWKNQRSLGKQVKKEEERRGERARRKRYGSKITAIYTGNHRNKDGSYTP